MSDPYVREDDHGVWRVGSTRVSFDSVAAAFELGHSAETIQDQYPALSLEQVYGAIAFYLANREDVHRYLQEQEKEWEQFRATCSANPSPVVERLRALRSSCR